MKPVGTLLVEGKMLHPEDLKNALTVQKKEGGRLLRLLLARDCFSATDLYHFLATLGYPTIDPLHYRIDWNTLSLIPRDFATEYELLPIDRMGPLLTVAMTYPLDQRTIRWAQRITRLEVKPLLAPFNRLRMAIEENYDLRRTARGAGPARYSSLHDAWRSTSCN
jgi:type IV pilus assembly protein PilB